MIFSTAPIFSLAGEWRFALDPQDCGIGERWFERSLSGGGMVQLPGSLAEQGIGEAVSVETAWTGTIFDKSYYTALEYAPYRQPGRVKIPFFLQPETCYVGPAWYQREIAIPAEWRGRSISLTLERPHWQTRVWLDEREIGVNDSLSAPHEYLLPPPSASFRLTIRVDNRLHVEVGENAHSVSDHTQGNWNGIVGRIELQPESARARLDELQVYPRVASRSAVVCGKVCTTQNHASPEGLTVELTAELPNAARPRPAVRQSAVVAPDGGFAAALFLGADAPTWDEFNPAVWRLTAALDGEVWTTTFGLREIAAEGRQLLLNGRKLFLRGALDCCVYPLTGHPPTDAESWRRVLRAAKAHGLNHLRFHSWCPPEAAFVAGDELGVYFQIECAAWPNAVAVLAFNSPAGIGDGAAVDAWVYAEAERILRAYGNHPCFVLMASGNEPGGPHHKEYLAAWVRHFRAQDSRRLYTGAAGWPELPGNDFHVISDPRIHQWGDGLNCRLNGQPPATTADYRAIIEARSAPVVSHEIGQWCSYPTLNDVGQYRGRLKARNYEIFRDSLAARGLGDQADAFAYASGKLQALCYKEEIESALRTPQMGGFQLLGLQDFPGQGTAPVGVMNAFWESKGYVTAAEFRRFCAETVPLARLPKRVFTAKETLEATLEVAHFGAAPLADAVVVWRLVDDAGNAVATGELPARDVPVGNGVALGHVSVPLHGLAAPERYHLVVGVADAPFENDWAIWVYPSAAEKLPNEVLMTDALNAAARAKLAAGGSVLLTVPPAPLQAKIALGFTPIFWNTACTQGQAPHTLGILCDPAHPALADFPTDCHTDWQWHELISRAGAMRLDGFPRALRPIVQVIDDWFTNRRLGLLFEARCGGGKLLVCSVDLRGDLSQRPVARQLLGSLLRYMRGTKFSPTVEVDPASLGEL